MKILVTTDFSTNSKGAIRFAHTIAKQSNEVEVTFYHAVHFLKPTKWSNDFFEGYKQEEVERLTKELTQFVNITLGKEKLSFAKMNFVIDSAIATEKNIILYAEKHKMNFIAIATQGAGILRKMVGTHTSYIVNNSKVPVLVIPSHYKAKPIKNIVYLSDFEDLKKELGKVTSFTNQLQSGLEVLHYSASIANKKKFENNLALLNKTENVKINISKTDLELSLVNRVAKFVTKAKPELLVMFTNREKGFFESIFIPSKSAELTYSTKVPVLVYSK
jgi:nucleotide-binding universal stress UspA family protein